MVFTTPLGNLKGFATSRPPLVVFTLCLTAFALTTLSLAYFINNSDTVVNPDVRMDWNTFLKYLSELELCVISDDSTTSISPPSRTMANASRATDDDDAVANVTISVAASLSLSSLPHNVSLVVGWLPWPSTCGGAGAINATLYLPRNLSRWEEEACVSLSGPRSLLPLVGKASSCSVPLTGTHSAITHMVAQHRGFEADDEWCKEGATLRVSYRSDPELAVVLTRQDRSLINLHLVHTSYFLFVMAMTLVCYALIKGKPKQKAVLLEKVPLDLRE